MLEIKKQIRQINCYVGQNVPAFIIIHETDNFSAGAGAAKHSQAHNAGNLSTSVHYYVDDKEIYQTLNHTDGAFAVGKEYGTPLVPGVTNKNTINIEICVNPDSNYATARLNCIDLVKYLIQTTGIPASKVIRHYDAKKKWCPRNMMDLPILWTEFKANLEVQQLGWVQKGEVWKYYRELGKPVCNEWQLSGDKWYWFDGSGRMVTNVWYQYEGYWYYLGSDGAMCSSQLVESSGKIYAVDSNGKMITEPVILTPVQDGALQYSGLAEQTKLFKLY